MEAKELRLGNYVKLSKDHQYVGIKIPAGTICKVETIEPSSLYLQCHVMVELSTVKFLFLW